MQGRARANNPKTPTRKERPSELTRVLLSAEGRRARTRHSTWKTTLFTLCGGERRAESVGCSTKPLPNCAHQIDSRQTQGGRFAAPWKRQQLHQTEIAHTNSKPYLKSRPNVEKTGGMRDNGQQPRFRPNSLNRPKRFGRIGCLAISQDIFRFDSTPTVINPNLDYVEWLIGV